MAASSRTIDNSSEADVLKKQITFDQSTHDQVATNSFAIAVLKLRKRYLSHLSPDEMNKRMDSVIRYLDRESKSSEDKKEEKTEEQTQSASRSAAIQYIINAATKEDVHKEFDYVRNLYMVGETKCTVPTTTTTTTSHTSESKTDNHEFTLKEVLYLAWTTICDENFMEDPARDRAHRLHTFWNTIEDLYKNKICHQGIRHRLILMLNKCHPDVNVIENKDLTVLWFLKDKLEKNFWALYNSGNASIKQRALAALFDWMKNNQPTKLLALAKELDPRCQDKWQTELEQLFAEHGTDPATIHRELTADIAKILAKLQFNCNAEEYPELIKIQTILSEDVSKYDAGFKSAVVKMQLWIQTQYAPENPAHKTFIHQFHLVYRSYVAYHNYKFVMAYSDVENPVEALASCEAYFTTINSMDEKATTPPALASENQEKMDKLFSAAQKAKKDQLVDLITNFFSFWYIDAEKEKEAEEKEDAAALWEIYEARKERYKLVYDRRFDSKILVPDDNWLEKAIASTTKIGYSLELVYEAKLPDPIDPKKIYIQRNGEDLFAFVKPVGKELERIPLPLNDSLEIILNKLKNDDHSPMNQEEMDAVFKITSKTNKNYDKSHRALTPYYINRLMLSALRTSTRLHEWSSLFLSELMEAVNFVASLVPKDPVDFLAGQTRESSYPDELLNQMGYLIDKAKGYEKERKIREWEQKEPDVEEREWRLSAPKGILIPNNVRTVADWMQIAPLLSEGEKENQYSFISNTIRDFHKLNTLELCYNFARSLSQHNRMQWLTYHFERMPALRAELYSPITNLVDFLEILSEASREIFLITQVGIEQVCDSIRISNPAAGIEDLGNLLRVLPETSWPKIITALEKRHESLDQLCLRFSWAMPGLPATSRTTLISMIFTNESIQRRMNGNGIRMLLNFLPKDALATFVTTHIDVVRKGIKSFDNVRLLILRCSEDSRITILTQPIMEFVRSKINNLDQIISLFKILPADAQVTFLTENIGFMLSKINKRRNIFEQIKSLTDVLSPVAQKKFLTENIEFVCSSLLSNLDDFISMVNNYGLPELVLSPAFIQQVRKNGGYDLLKHLTMMPGLLPSQFLQALGIDFLGRVVANSVRIENREMKIYRKCSTTAYYISNSIHDRLSDALKPVFLCYVGARFGTTIHTMEQLITRLDSIPEELRIQCLSVDAMKRLVKSSRDIINLLNKLPGGARLACLRLIFPSINVEVEAQRKRVLEITEERGKLPPPKKLLPLDPNGDMKNFSDWQEARTLEEKRERLREQETEAKNALRDLEAQQKRLRDLIQTTDTILTLLPLDAREECISLFNQVLLNRDDLVIMQTLQRLQGYVLQKDAEIKVDRESISLSSVLGATLMRAIRGFCPSDRNVDACKKILNSVNETIKMNREAVEVYHPLLISYLEKYNKMAASKPVFLSSLFSSTPQVTTCTTPAKRAS